MPEHPAEARRPRRSTWIVLGAYMFVALMLSFTSGALESDFAAFQDEPSHLVSGLLIRDWLASGASVHPMRFAEEYYLHYPKVAIGQWPPAFHLLLGVWMLFFGASQASVLTLQSLLAALLGLIVFRVTRKSCGEKTAACAGLLVLLLGPVQAFGHMAMTELFLTVSCMLAVLAFGRFVETGRGRWSLAFGLLAGLAIMTKGNALALALVPGSVIVATRRWDLLKRPALWGSALVVGLVCGPWYALTLNIARGSWAGGASPNLDFSMQAIPFYASEWVALGGWLVGLAAVFGLARRGGSDPVWTAIAVWPLCLLFLHGVLPSSFDERHMILIAPSFACGFAATAADLAQRAPRWRQLSLAPAVLFLAFGLEAFEKPRKDVSGYGTAARALVGDPSLMLSPFLIASDSFGEGAFVAGVALAEERPGHVVLRATKVLGTSDWIGRNYVSTFASADEMDAWLEQVPVGIVAFDDSTQTHHWYEHQDLLREVVDSDPERWVPVGEFDVVREGVSYPGALKLYRQARHEMRLPAQLKLGRVLGRQLPGF